MNKTININLGGLFFHIDENAFQKLNRYLDAVSRSLSDDPQGKDEIISDIEARISELLSEKIKDVRQVVNENDIEEIIVIMGQPEDYSDDEETYSENKTSYKRKKTNAKKLFRNGDDKFLGGVCAGLAHYLAVDTIWIRLAFIVLTFSGFPLFIYIILWILLPEAKTTSEKLQMEGEPVNIGNIEKKIRDEIENLSLKFKDGANDLSEKISSADYDKLRMQTKSGLQDFLETVGKIFSAIFKVFGKFLGGLLLFISGIALISIVFGMFSVGSIEILDFDNDFIHYPIFFYDSILPKWLLTLFLLLLIGIPFFVLFILGLRILSPNTKKINTTTSLSLLGLWIVSLLGTSFAGIEYASSHAQDATKVIKKEITYNSNIPLKIAVENNDDIYYNHNLSHRNNAIEINLDDEKLKYSNDVTINIKESETGKAYIQLKKIGQGRKRQDALKNAENINYEFNVIDNRIIFNAYFLSEYKNIHKDEEIKATLYIPKGTSIYFEKSSKKFLYGIDNTDDIYDREMAGHQFKMTAKGFECTDCSSEDAKVDNAESSNTNNDNELSFLFDSTINDYKAEFIIDKKTTKEELNRLIKWFKSKRNIDINIVSSKFDGKNQIKNLSLKIDTNDGYNGAVTISKNTLKTIPKGFVRRYNDDELDFKTW